MFLVQERHPPFLKKQNGRSVVVLVFCREGLAEQPIVRHAVHQDYGDANRTYENSNLVCFAPCPVGAIEPKDLANQIGDHTVMRQLERG